jgi:hypothetical protein
MHGSTHVAEKNNPSENRRGGYRFQERMLEG